MRVSQLDAHLLDQELFALLATNIDSALSLFKTSDALSNTSKTLLRAIIWKLGIWDHGTTYGASMQQLRYFNLTTTKKIVLGLVSVFGPLISEAVQSELSPRLQRIVSKFEAAYEFATLLNFVSFISGSRYDSLLHRILGVQLKSTSLLYRAVSFEFLNRQLIWSQFTEFLLVFIPLLNLPRLKQRIQKYFPQKQFESLAFLDRRKCAICYNDGVQDCDIVVPYEADCGDLYCYGCIVPQIAICEGEGWECLKCGAVVKSAKPYDERVRTPAKIELLSSSESGEIDEASGDENEEDDEEDDSDGIEVVNQEKDDEDEDDDEDDESD